MLSTVKSQELINQISPEFLARTGLDQTLPPLIENLEKFITIKEHEFNNAREMGHFTAQCLDELQGRGDKTRKGLQVRREELAAKCQQRHYEKSKAFNAGMQAQLNKIKRCVRILDEHEGSVEALSHSDQYMTCEPNLTTDLSREAKRADEVFAELMKEETPCKKTRSAKKKPKKPQQPQLVPTTQVEVEPTGCLPPPKVLKVIYSGNELLQQVIQLNSSHSDAYRLHSRVQRWKDASFDDIRKFVDYKNDKVAHWYADMDDADLKYQKDTHNIGWAKEIISGPLADAYTVSHHYSTTQRGKALFITMHSSKEVTPALAVLGIGTGGVIYHAQVRPFLQKDIVPSYVASLLQVAPLAKAEAQPSDETKSPGDGEWEHASRVTFSLVDKNVIQIKRTVPKQTEKATFYRVYPLHE